MEAYGYGAAKKAISVWLLLRTPARLIEQPVGFVSKAEVISPANRNKL